MDSNAKFTSVASIVFAIATVMLGWVNLKQRHVESVRDNEARALVEKKKSTVVARLWEDPLGAIKKESQVLKEGSQPRRQSADEAPSTPIGESQFLTCVSKLGCKDQMLLISVPDTSFPEDIETRLRLRYCAQMALANAGYKPKDSDALEFFEFKGCQASDTTDGFCAYESFIKEERTAIIVWLPESLLGEKPLSRLNDLVGLARSQHKGCDNLTTPKAKFPVAFVGPRSSDTLRSMALEALARKGILDELGDKFTIFSSQATALEGDLLSKTANTDGTAEKTDLNTVFSRAIFHNAANEARVVFLRYIAADNELVDLLKKELGRRAIPLQATGSNRILVLAEADTQYGQSLARTFLGEEATEKKKGSSVVVYRYLRGLDRKNGSSGENSPRSRQASNRNAEETLEEALGQSRANALGESQLDYVDRMAESIAQKNRGLNVSAIGIFGSDVYDKLILIRALKKHFDGVLLFSTDLDARLWNPSSLPFTRNMVIASASSHEVDVSPTGSGKVETAVAGDYRLSFRDCYQATTYRAIVEALQPPPYKTSEISPSLYEIGRHGPVLLESGSPAKPLNFGRFGCILGAVVLFACVIAVVVRQGFLRASLGPTTPLYDVVRQKALRQLSWLFIIPAILAVICIGKATLCGVEEPLSFRDGVSALPTEILRFVIVTAVAAALLHARLLYIGVRSQIQANYSVERLSLRSTQRLLPEDERGPELQIVRKNRLRFLDWFKIWPGGDLDSERPARASRSPRYVEAINLFRIYRSETKPSKRLQRVFAGIAVYLTLGFLICYAFEGGLPIEANVRGPCMRAVDVYLRFSAVIAYQFFLFFTLDAVRTASCLFIALARGSTNWNLRARGEIYQELERLNFHTLSDSVEPFVKQPFLDVRFTAMASKATQQLVVYCFVIQALFLVSRCTFIDGWSWPTSLMIVFVLNFLMAAIGWIAVRHDAKKVRDAAIREIQEQCDECESSTSRSDETKLRRWRLMLRLVTEERGGAYAPFFQDPALMATLIPSGVIGILTILCQQLFTL